MKFPSSERSALLSIKHDINPIQGVYKNMKAIKHMEIVARDPLRCFHVEKCLKYMEKLTLKDIGLSLTALDRITTSQCLNIADSEQFQISAFIIPAGCFIPLHDHPNMAVCSKVIHGSVRLQSFTPLSSLPQPSGEMNCTLVFDDIKSNSDAPWLLTPTSGNIHSFQAITTCVIFDVLLPPYDDPLRPCVFYHATELRAQQGSATDKAYKLEVLADEEVLLPEMREYCGYMPLEEEEEGQNSSRSPVHTAAY